MPERPEVVYKPVTMRDVLENWNAVECDLHEVYGIDCEDDDLMTSRSWRWLEIRMLDLINRGPRLGLALRASVTAEA